nr:RNA-directed DNA polymerase, eukaryota, reverse transcriptase zinc-binding domain protein [Tanacetum cinerariifolium]
MVEDAYENLNIVSSSLCSLLSKSFANILNADKKSSKINFRSLFNEDRVEDADFVLPVKNVKVAQNSFRKVMRDDDDVFYFKLNLVKDLEQGRISYARPLIKISTNTDLKKVVSMAVPIIDGEGYTKESMVIEYEWKPPWCIDCYVFGHDSLECPKHVVEECPKVKTKTTIDESQRYIYVDDEINMMKLKYLFDSLIKADKVLDTVQPDDMVSNDKNRFNDEDDDIEEVFAQEPMDEKWSNTIDVQKGASTPIIVNDISGFRMYKVVKRLKLLKKPFRKIFDEQGNIFDTVKRLRVELDDVQLALDSDPSNYDLREEEAAYLNCVRRRLHISKGKEIARAPSPISKPEPEYDDLRMPNNKQNANNMVVVVAGNKETVAKRVMDFDNHKENMSLCKKEEARILLSAEEHDRLIDSDGETEDQELEAHYIYMAKIQEVRPATYAKTLVPPIILNH